MPVVLVFYFCVTIPSVFYTPEACSIFYSKIMYVSYAMGACVMFLCRNSKLVLCYGSLFLFYRVTIQGLSYTTEACSLLIF